MRGSRNTTTKSDITTTSPSGFRDLACGWFRMCSVEQVSNVRLRRLNGGMFWRLLCCPTSSAKSRDVAHGRGVDGRRAADNVGCSPTAAASGSGPPGTPLSERTGLSFCLYCCVSTLVSGSIWPPGALREAPAWRTLSDPIPPSAACTGADGGAASSCGKDSSFSAAVRAPKCLIAGRRRRGRRRSVCRQLS